jgi:hypothetical protein
MIVIVPLQTTQRPCEYLGITKPFLVIRCCPTQALEPTPLGVERDRSHFDEARPRPRPGTVFHAPLARPRLLLGESPVEPRHRVAAWQKLIGKQADVLLGARWPEHLNRHGVMPMLIHKQAHPSVAEHD